ncbi:iron ABC transporter permease [Wenjunlia vitaminophila]|uniref:Iron ABC transporter permease n=1 Tax=Wenjunlia vitaminophila TaxID=76728 RepID=A0A0T6LVJ2_WENVI|nr:iron ABC transporter permease [Wenjunlia vitaminophila]KRV50074.1 iron ABC transporter permease [Wenjunlia vitaminophila]
MRTQPTSGVRQGGVPPDGGGPPRGALLRRRVGALLVAGALLLLAVLLSLAVGARHIPPDQVLDALIHGGDTENAQVVRDLRMPRTLVGIAVGVALAVAGVVMQGVTRNPIAEPGILGVSHGAAAGVVLAIAVFGVHDLYGYMWFAYLGAAVAAVLVYAVAAHGREGATPVKLALAGAAINAFLASVVSAALTTNAAALDEFRFWQVGSVSGRETRVAWVTLLVVAFGGCLVLLVVRGLDALALGEDVATALGQNVALVRLVGALAAVVLTGAAVAAAGPIAFVGLTVPHLARGLVGAAHGWVLAMSALLGPTMLLVSDVVGRIVFPPSEVPAGVMTALIGVPFLVALVRRRTVVAT